MTHGDFVGSYRSSAIQVRVNRSLAFQVMNSSLLPLRYRAAWVFWTWVWFLMLPGSIVLAVFYHWWAGILGLVLASAVLNGARQSALEFVLEHALNDAKFYDAMSAVGLFHIRPSPGTSGLGRPPTATPRPDPTKGLAAPRRDPTRDVGQCEHCEAEFEYWLFALGHANAAFAYCSDCGMTAILELYPDKWPKGLTGQRLGPVGHDAEAWLEPCACGGRYKGTANPRCPFCRCELDPEIAASYLEASTPLAKRGWWVRSWHRNEAIVLEGRAVWNPWPVAAPQGLTSREGEMGRQDEG